MGTISSGFPENSPPQVYSGFHNLNENSNPQNYQGYHHNLNNLNENSPSQTYSGYLNENYQQQNFSSIIRPRRNSAPQETMENSTSYSPITNPTSALRQRIDIKNCDCGLEPVLREVKVNTINKGRLFWSCSKFGTRDHADKCNFFKWENSLNQNSDMAGESSSTAHNTQDTEYNNNNNDNNDDVNDDNNNNNNLIVGDEVNTPSFNDNERITGSPCHNRASSQASSNTSNGTTTNRSPTSPTNRTINPVVGSNETRTTISLTGDIYARRPAVFGNWENVPKYTSPQLLDILQTHLVQQDKNYQKWYTSTQSAKKDYEVAKKEVEKLVRELDIIKRDNELYKRENDVLKAEKRLLERENIGLKEENREMKRRH